MKNIIEINGTNFESEVLQSTKPVLVDFWAPWCGPCRMLGRTIEEIANEHAGRFKIAKVNVDENLELAGRFGIQAVPTLLYFADGEVRHEVVGAVSKARILEALESLAGAPTR